MARKARAKVPLLPACNVCDPTLRRAIADGGARELRLETSEPARLHCANERCGSRPRHRTFGLLLDEHILHRLRGEREELTALTLDGLAAIRRNLSPYFGTVLDAGGPRRPLRTDARTLEGIDDGGVHLLSVAQSYDGIVQLDEAFAAARRALAPNGLLAFHLNPGRLRAGKGEPTLLSDEPPRVAVGLEWILAALAEGDFEPAYLYYADPFTGVPAPWLLARRLQSPP